MPRISFLGSGNMASAIVAGVLNQKVATAADLACLGGNDPSVGASITWWRNSLSCSVMQAVRTV